MTYTQITKQTMKTKVEKIEFQLSNGSHIVWMKEPSGWRIIKYVHGEESIHLISTHLPTILNALYMDTRLRFKKATV